MQDLTLSLIQADLHWQDPLANRAELTKNIASLSGATDLIILPEMFTTGFTMEAAGLAESMDGPSVRWMADMAKKAGTTLCGSLIIESGGRHYNRLVWMPPQGQATCYDKRHLFRMAGEQDHYSAGEQRVIASLKGWRICPLVCYDLRFPVWSRGVNEFELLLYVANWPASRRSAWRTLLPARAVENLCYVAGVNRVGTAGNGVNYIGESGVYDYLGNPLAEGGEDARVLTVQLSGRKLMRYRDKFPAWRDADHFRLVD